MIREGKNTLYVDDHAAPSVTTHVMEDGRTMAIIRVKPTESVNETLFIIENFATESMHSNPELKGKDPLKDVVFYYSTRADQLTEMECKTKPARSDNKKGYEFHIEIETELHVPYLQVKEFLSLA